MRLPVCVVNIPGSGNLGTGLVGVLDVVDFKLLDPTIRAAKSPGNVACQHPLVLIDISYSR